MVISACSRIFLLFSTPIFSTVSSVSRIPAVSIKFKSIPLYSIVPSTISLVVPDISVTIALSSSNNAFNKDDFPTFGLPMIAIFIPFFIFLLFSDSSTIFCNSFFISVKTGVIFSLVICNSSIYSG